MLFSRREWNEPRYLLRVQIYDTSIFLFYSKGDVVKSGCGCNVALVNEITEELQARVSKRGQAAQTNIAMQTFELVSKIDAKLAEMDLKLKKLTENMER